MHREKADIVFALNQPLPLLLAIYLFKKITGTKYILDSHSNPFNNPSLSWQRPFYRFFASRAFININTNNHHKRLVQSWGGRSYVISDVPIEFNDTYPMKEVSKKSIAVVASFDYDEPIHLIWKAAKQLTDVQFFVTGNYNKAKKKLPKTLPTNIKLLGFISRHKYIGLLKSVKAVMALTIRDNTMQRGGYEALSLEKPIITSDWEILRESFGEGAVYVLNRSESIVTEVNRLFNNYDFYKKKVIKQKKERKKYFERTKRLINREIANISQS